MPNSAKRAAQQDAYFRIMRLIEVNPEYTQRQISEALGVSLGLVNFCLRQLIEVGFVKAENFRSAKNKRRYIYILTPSGIARRVVLTGAFLRRKIADYDALRAEIEELGGYTGAGQVQRTPE